MNSPTPFHPTTTTTAIPNGTLHQTLMLDSSIRDWVVLPLLIIMILTGLFRFYLSIVLKPDPVKLPSIEHRVKNALIRCSKLRMGGMGYIDECKWNARKEYWADHIEGYWKEELIWVEEEKEEIANQKKSALSSNNATTNEDGTPSENSPEQPQPEEGGDDMPNPMEMMGGMKGQAVAMVQNMVMMQGIAFFFQGYVLVKVPFPLTQGFKLMFQRGLDLSTLDTSYVSSVSWYFLVMFGLRSFFKLVMDGKWNSYSGYGTLSSVQDESTKLQLELGVNVNAPPGAAAAAAGGNKFDAAKVIQMELENLEIAKYCRGNASLEDVEWRLLGGNAYKKKKRKGGAAAGLRGKAGDPRYDIFGTAAAGGASKKKGKVKSN